MRTTTERGYGAAHRAERKRWAAILTHTPTQCTRCQQPITPDQPWDLDHDDTRNGYLGPAHTTCNRAAGGRNGRAAQLATNTHTIRDW